MDLSIIIVSWNTRDALRTCLASIEAQRGNLALEVIVVDNDSVDGTCEMVSQCFPAVCLIRSGGNLGFARGCNLGLGHADAPLILFLNPDTEVREQALTKMVAFMAKNAPVAAMNCLFREPTGDAFGPGLQWFPSPLTELAVLLLVSRRTEGKLARLLPYHAPESSGYVRKLYGGCLLVRRSVLDQVGLFDERFFMYCEDVDLSRRIQQAGWKLYYLAEAEMLHAGGGASAGAPSGFSSLMMCESFSKLMRKYYGRAGSIGYRAVTIIGSVFRLLLLSTFCGISRLGLQRMRIDYAVSVRRYRTVLQWAVGLRKAFIPRQTCVGLPGLEGSGKQHLGSRDREFPNPSSSGVEAA